MDTEQRIAAVRKRLRVIQTDEVMAEGAGPPCSQCIFGPINDTGQGKCDHIAHWQRHHDPVSGKWKGRLEVTTAEARSEEGLCGPEGLLFEPYPPLRKVARWLSVHGPLPLFYAILVLFGLVCATIITIQGRWE